MLTKKYAPKFLDDLVYREKLVEPLKNKIQTEGTIGHCLFVGQQGTGKTATAYCIKNELFGADTEFFWYQANASDNTSVDFVRTQIKSWASLVLPKRKDGNKRHRIILLDEFDYTTANAQACLRRLMEDHSDTCRFILTANYPDKIIAPIKSRCSVFEFSPIPAKPIFMYLQWIASEEGKEADKQSLITIAKECGGDLRKALEMLEQHFHGRAYRSKATTELKLLKMKYDEVLTLSYQQDPRILFRDLEGELIYLAKKGKDVAKAFVLLSTYEHRSATSNLKSLHFQVAWNEIKGTLKK